MCLCLCYCRRGSGPSDRPERLKIHLAGRGQSGAHIKHSSVVLREPVAPDGVKQGFSLGRGRPRLNPNASAFVVPGSVGSALDEGAVEQTKLAATDAEADTSQFEDAPDASVES